MTWPTRVDIESLLGKTLTTVKRKEINGDDSLEFVADDGTRWIMKHERDCCESVWLEDIAGLLEHLTHSPITQAYASFSSEDKEYGYHSTWSFYTFGTVKGTVVLRWLGESNGYYSETVDLYLMPKETPEWSSKRNA